MNDCYCIKNIQKSIETVPQTVIFFYKIIRYLLLTDWNKQYFLSA